MFSESASSCHCDIAPNCPLGAPVRGVSVHLNGRLTTAAYSIVIPVLFPETSWTILAAATMNGDDDGRAALDALCREYWRPVAICIRKRGAPADRVDDLTQDFFLQLMQKSFFRRADPVQGRFRTFMLSSLRHFLIDDVRRAATQKKGGHLTREELTEDAASTEVEDTHFDQAWAELIFDRALERLAGEVTEKRGKEAWEQLRAFLPGGDPTRKYEDAAPLLGMSEGGVKTDVFRLRKRFRDALRSEVGRTVDAPHEIDEELAYLRSALAAK